VPKTRRPISFRQLCLLATEQLRAEPTIDNAEWKARIQDRAHAVGFLTPWTEEVYRAMDAVERSTSRRARSTPLSFSNPTHRNLEPPKPAPRTIHDLPQAIREMVLPAMKRFGARGFEGFESSKRASTDPTRARVAIAQAINDLWQVRAATCNEPWCAHCRAVCDETRTCPECSGAPMCEACFKELR
jgi:hypothetical protein